MNAEAGLRVIAAACIALVAPLAVGESPPPIQLDEDEGESYEHLIAPAPYVITAWEDITRFPRGPHWNFEITVDEQGKVHYARLIEGSKRFRELAMRAARETRFRPFLRDGRAVPVRFQWTVHSRPADYEGPADRSFPIDPGPGDVVIALARTGCFGSCPAYRVELHGDGRVRYRGEAYVLVEGEHRWRVDPAGIKSLLELFRKADFLSLSGYYEADISDLPAYITRISIGGRHKYVYNYGGSFQLGNLFDPAEPAEGRRPVGPDMPPIVTEIEDAIDSVAGSGSYVSGDAATIRRLNAAGWKFTSRDAGRGLGLLLSECKTDLAREFVRRGAPVNTRGRGFVANLPISSAAGCGDVELTRMLVAKGALDNRADAVDFLWSSVWSGDPEMVALALEHHADVRVKGEGGKSLLAGAAESFVLDDDPRVKRFDAVKVIELLLDAGADPNARNDDGETPLFEANDPQVVAALVRGGADPNARDEKGRTALFNPYFADVKQALIAAGARADTRDSTGRTALFFQSHPDSVKSLLAGGVDIEATSTHGHTAIEEMQSEEAVDALLAAGARLPADPARLQAMIDTAAKRKWDGLLNRLRSAAAN